jgi:acetyl-CoA/propionyl-CoA carboxylase biotin carboxyl carrier protein
MFKKVLIANRGEVAVRINSTLQKLGIDSIGVFTNSDRTSTHIKNISQTVLLEDSELTGYLDIAQLISVAKKNGVDAIHPGYGFLAENSDFSQACAESGIKFIGPSSEVISAMGDKISARIRAEAAGVPIVPGVGTPGMSDQDLLDACQNMTFPLLVKPSAGGGGKGLHIVENIDQLQAVLPIARREAFASFSDDTLFVEKYIKSAKHIEFQILRDSQGISMHLGERECSLQRRHQKVIEEAPSAVLTSTMRDLMGKTSLLLADAINYENIGTVEFLVDAQNPEIFYFMEMNTRLQVEHRVTEMITGIDLVECQIRIASGESLKSIIPKVNFFGHAIEARIYSEDAYSGFLPSGGQIGVFAASERIHTINDFAIDSGTFVSSTFDPMLGKISCWAESRTDALSLLQASLSETAILGVTTNIDFLQELLGIPEIVESTYDTSYLEKLDLVRSDPSSNVFEAYAHALMNSKWEDSDQKMAWAFDNWRLTGSPQLRITGYLNGKRFDVLPSKLPFIIQSQLKFYIADQNCWIHHPIFGTWLFSTTSSKIRSAEASVAGEVVSPMPGIVISAYVSVGDKVVQGDSLIVIEAMKMEHVIKSKVSGTVQSMSVDVGINIKAGQVLLEISENV